MDNQENKGVLTNEELKKKAYSLALDLRRQGLDFEEMYGRLQKEGIPTEIAANVLWNFSTQLRSRERKEERGFLHVALIRLLVGLAGAIIVLIFWPDRAFLPIIMVLGGIASAVAAKLRMDR